MTSSSRGRKTSRMLIKVVSSLSCIERRRRFSWLCGNGSKVLKKMVFADCFMTKVPWTSQSTEGPKKVTLLTSFEFSLNFRKKKSIVVNVETCKGQSTLYKFLMSPNSSTEKFFNMSTTLLSYWNWTVKYYRTPRRGNYRILITIIRDSLKIHLLTIISKKQFLKIAVEGRRYFRQSDSFSRCQGFLSVFRNKRLQLTMTHEKGWKLFIWIVSFLFFKNL